MLLIQRGKEERLISQLITLLALSRHKHSRWDSIKSPSLVHWLVFAACSTALHVSGSPVFSVAGSWCLIALSAPVFNAVLVYCSHVICFDSIVLTFLCSRFLLLSLSFLPSSLCRHWIYCNLLESNLYTAFPHISTSPMLTLFSLLRPTRQLLTPPWQCRNYTGQISWFSLRHHLNQFIGQSFGNQEIADTLDSICPNTRLGSHFVEGRIVQWTDATA